jgi:hypothetical protein
MEHVFSVGTIKELSQAMPESGTTVFVLGHSIVGDGGGGMFHWQKDSLAEPDFGTVVANIDTNHGRWKRLDSGSVNVRWFGAKGDGSDATLAIQRALNAAKLGGSVYIPSGIYSITKPLKIYQGTALHGDGLFTRLHYSGKENTGCICSATPKQSCSFNFSKLNVEVFTEGAWGFDLRGMSFSRFDHLSVHLRTAISTAYYGPGDGQSPYYNLFSSCHIAGPGNEKENGCVGFNFTFDQDIQRQSANANQIVGGHINSVQKGIVCYGTGNIFYGQVLEQCNDGYVFALMPGRLNDASKGTVNTIAGCYTEYVKRVIVQQHASCVVNAELTHTTGYESVFDGKDKSNCVVLTTHDGRLEQSRSFIHRRIDLKID